MSNFVFADNVSTILASAVTSGATSISVSSTANMPSSIPTGYVFPLTLNDVATGLIFEVVYATAISGSALTVIRAQEGTTAQNWAIGSYVYCAPSAGQMSSLQLSAPVIGDARNVLMQVAAASATATLTADEIVTKSILGGSGVIVASFSATVVLTTTGAGGMDTGSAPNHGFVALYVIYNPTTATAALLASNATSTVAPGIYGGSSMPTGYVQSALVSVWPTNGSGQFVVGVQQNRTIQVTPVTALNSPTTEASPTSLSLGSGNPVTSPNPIIPPNAKAIHGFVSAASTTTGTVGILVYSTTTAVGSDGFNSGTSAVNPLTVSVSIPIITPQTIYYTCSNSAGTPTFTIAIASYTV